MTVETRYCPKCKQMHSADNFYLNKKGNPRGYCKPCAKQRSKESFQSLDKDHIKARNNAWFERQSDEFKKAQAAKKAEKIRIKRASDVEAAREAARKTAAKRRASIQGMLKNRVTAGMNASLARAGAKRKNWMNWESIVGYTGEDLKAHIESLFKDGMSWENRSEWHIDHIRPLASFNFDGPDHPEFKQAWALENLQPLWALENQKKHAKLNWSHQLTA